MHKYRNVMTIQGSILDAAHDKGMEGIQVTNLIAKSNLSHPRLKEFLTKLIGNNLINKIEVKGRHTFIITEKGRLYLEEYKKFVEFSESFGLEL